MVRESDEGTYSCTPYSALGASKYSPNFQVHVRGIFLHKILIMHCVFVTFLRVSRSSVF